MSNMMHKSNQMPVIAAKYVGYINTLTHSHTHTHTCNQSKRFFLQKKKNKYNKFSLNKSNFF